MRKYLPHILIISFVFIAIPITSATGGSITLRSSYKTLSLSEVHSMPNVSIREKYEWGFKGHSTINHYYNLKTIGGDKVAVDTITGLMWHQNGSESMDWDKAKDWVRSLNSSGYAGHHDWRLPTLEEAASLLESSMSNGRYIDSVFSDKQGYIWTGDRCEELILSTMSLDYEEAVWSVGFHAGSMARIANGYSRYVRPVRSMK